MPPWIVWKNSQGHNPGGETEPVPIRNGLDYYVPWRNHIYMVRHNTYGSIDGAVANVIMAVWWQGYVTSTNIKFLALVKDSLGNNLEVHLKTLFVRPEMVGHEIAVASLTLTTLSLVCLCRPRFTTSTSNIL